MEIEFLNIKHNLIDNRDLYIVSSVFHHENMGKTNMTLCYREECGVLYSTVKIPTSTVEQILLDIGLENFESISLILTSQSKSK